jgi:hypothetical protein
MPEGNDMTATKAAKTTAPVQQPQLASQYRAIGPAAILAALLFRTPVLGTPRSR